MELENEFGKEIEQHKPNQAEQERVLGLSKREQMIEKCERLNKNLTPIFDKSLYNCEKCNNSGAYYIIEKHEYILQNGDLYEDESLVAKVCECMKVRESLRMLQESGLTPIMKTHTFESYRTDESWQKEVKEKAQAYLTSEVGTFYIGGFTGSGKTKICSCILNEYIKQNKAVRYIVWNDFVNDLMSDFETAKQKVAELQKVDVLYIDDLYKFPPKDFEKKVLFMIMNYRARANMKTLISSEIKVMNEQEEKNKFVDLYSLDLAVAGRIWENAGNGEFVIAIANEPKYNMRFKGE